MRLLSAPTRPLVSVLAVLVLACVASQTSAHPPHTPDHGVNESTACTIWAGDNDTENVTVYEEQVSDTTPEICTLAPLTDVPLDSPPVAVDRWNRGDLANFPAGDVDRSHHPPNASLHDGRFLKDAYTEIFAVQPSTRARIAPGEHELYVAPNGSVLGTVDYRVELPPDVSTRSRHVSWSIDSHAIADTRLTVDGDRESNASSDHTPSLDYTLDTAGDPSHALALEAEITVAVRKRVETCVSRARDGSCSAWRVRVTIIPESVTASDTIDVTSYDLSVSGYRGRYPNGDLGLVLFKNRPWLGYSVPGGDVRGVWRFYAARDTAWDELVTASESNQTTQHSPLHPLQVTAYPIEPGPTASPHARVKILDVFGGETEPPTLPDAVQLDVLNETYVASFGLATRTETAASDLSAVTANGLVRGIDAEVSEGTLAEIPIHRTNLTLSWRNRTDETVSVRVRLRDNETGDPIETADREGYVIVRDRRVNTTANGSAIVTLPRGDGGVAARYVPDRWWETNPGFVGDSDVLYVEGTGLALVAVLFEFGVPLSLLLAGLFVVDRFTGWHLWPPWRRV